MKAVCICTFIQAEIFTILIKFLTVYTSWSFLCASSLLLMLYIYGRPVNPSLDPATRLYGWRYLSLHHYCCYIYIYIYRTVKTQKRVRHKETPTAADKKMYCLKSGKYFGLNKIYNGLLQYLSVQLKVTELVKPKYHKTNYKLQNS